MTGAVQTTLGAAVSVQGVTDSRADGGRPSSWHQPSADEILRTVAWIAPRLSRI